MVGSTSSYDGFQRFLVFQTSPGGTIISLPCAFVCEVTHLFPGAYPKGFTASQFSATITLYYTRNAAFGVVYSAFIWQVWETFCPRRKGFSVPLMLN